MRYISYSSGGDFPVNPEPYFTISCNCHYCGNRTATAIDKDSDYDRAEARYWEEKYRDLMGQLNGMIARLSREHGYNPVNEIWISELAEIREKLSKKQTFNDDTRKESR